MTIPDLSVSLKGNDIGQAQTVQGLSVYLSSFTVMPEREGAMHEDLLRMFAQRLEDVRAGNVTVEENSVGFTGGVFRLVSNWNLLVGITSGRIELEPEADRIAYSLSFIQLVVGGTVMIGLMAVFMGATGFPSVAFFCGLPFMWLWLVGMNYLITLARFDRFIKRCIRDAGFSIVKRQAPTD